MRNTFQKNDGFTLVELMVTILTGSIVTMAAVTILLLGLRINKQSTDTASRQMTTRILLSSLEDLATQGTITEVVSKPGVWEVHGDGGQVLYFFDSASHAIYSGGEASKTTIMESVIASDVMLEGQLLTVTVETEDGTYSSSVYCRMAVSSTESIDINEMINSSYEEDDEDNTSMPDVDARVNFLQRLAGQYSIITTAGSLRNPGLILQKQADGKYYSTGKYYSEWYVEDYKYAPGWNSQTPWCACFISWGLLGDENNPLVDFSEDHKKGFASVDYFMNYLKKGTNGHSWKDSRYYDTVTPYDPLPGDLIFFDWTVNSVRDPAHIGAVIRQDGEYVYTIEGNSSNRVAVRKYKLDDPRIIGYGVLNWSTTS